MRFSVRAFAAVVLAATTASAQPFSRAARVDSDGGVPAAAIAQSAALNADISRARQSASLLPQAPYGAPHSLAPYGTPDGTSISVIAAAPLTPPTPQEVIVRNYARRGLIIGALGTGAVAAIIAGYSSKRDCDPGLCDSEFRRGAFVGGAVGLAAGGVLGWLIGSAITQE